MKACFKESNGQFSGISVELNQEGTTFRFWAASSTAWSMLLVCGTVATEPCLGLINDWMLDFNLSAASATYFNVQINSFSSQETK